MLQAEGDNVEDLVDLQLSLVAYTQVVIKNLCDSVPKLVYTQLVSTVRLLEVTLQSMQIQAIGCMLLSAWKTS